VWFESGPDPLKTTHLGSSPRPRAISFQIEAVSASKSSSTAKAHWTHETSIGYKNGYLRKIDSLCLDFALSEIPLRRRVRNRSLRNGDINRRCEIGKSSGNLRRPNSPSPSQSRKETRHERRGKRMHSSIVIEISQHLLENFPCDTLTRIVSDHEEEDSHEDASHCLWKGV
jgi:hypothetical protein